jgi:DNA-binding NtrC family response regulator
MRGNGEAAVENDAAGNLIDVAVLDDDIDFLRYVEDFLKDEGCYSVRAFSHPEDLFDEAGRRPPDIVLLDMKMGEFRGEQVLEEMQARHPGICVIVVTGYPSLEDMRKTFRLKVFDYLAKPFSLAELRRTLENVVNTYGLGRAPQDLLRERLGHRIKMLRVERKWSLKDMAGETKLSVSQISSIERGAHLPSMESFLAICHAFEKRPSEVLAAIEF